jgi:hypothetical protein
MKSVDLDLIKRVLLILHSKNTWILNQLFVC